LTETNIFSQIMINEDIPEDS